MKHTVVVVNHENQMLHKQVALANIGRKLANLKQCAFIDDPKFNEWSNCSGFYYLPSRTLSLDQAPAHVADWTVHDLLGGIVAHAFISTKLISHPLFEPEAVAPHGWSQDFPAQIRNYVLPGFSVFSADEFITAGQLLLEAGPLRVKAAYAEGGSDQCVLTNVKELVALCDQLPAEALTRGYVLEENLADTRTYSVGQLWSDGHLISYFGEQRLTKDNNGHETYGGTTLEAVPGDWNALQQHIADPAATQIILAACEYDRCAHDILHITSSRRNYDVITGTDARGQVKTAVLEQSWRAGGATAAELLALEALTQDPSLVAVRAASYEMFGGMEFDDADIFISFRGDDPNEGPMTKYAKLEARYYAEHQSRDRR